jgi:hypothetical protein
MLQVPTARLSRVHTALDCAAGIEQKKEAALPLSSSQALEVTKSQPAAAARK